MDAALKHDTLEEDEETDEAEEAADQAEVTETVRRVYARPSDPPIKDLYDRFKDGDLVLQPGFQRYFIWDRTKSSRLIESVLLEVPLPIVYLAEDLDGKESVIDGQQRLTSFFDFLDGKFALQGLRIRADLLKKTYADLQKDLQATIRRTPIRTVTIQRESDEDLKFDIFERLNSGAVALNDQELRNCVYRGPYNTLLRELAGDPDFMYLLRIKAPERRMRDVELALRFASFFHTPYLQYRSPISQFLNRDMRQWQNISPGAAAELRQQFKKSSALVRSLLGEHAFRRFYRGTDVDPNGYWEPSKFNVSLYDVLMYGFTLYDKSQVHPYLDSIREALIWLMTADQAFIEAIELSTSSVKMVTARFDKWRLMLKDVMGAPRHEPRLFSRRLKETLFRGDPTCTICHQRIQDADDSAVDHVEQYWMGGKTIPQNARLTHRYCNWSRPRH